MNENLDQFTKRVMNELRPVEALYLLDNAGEEMMSPENALAAVLAYLANEKYIETKNNEFCLTDKGRHQREGLRKYEVNCLNAIEKKLESELYYAIENYELKEELTEKGFFEKKKKKRGWWIFKWTQTNYIPTEKYRQTVKELKKWREEISSLIGKGDLKQLNKDALSLAYAFPSSGIKDGLLRYAREKIESYKASQAAIEAAAAACVAAAAAASAAYAGT